METKRVDIYYEESPIVEWEVVKLKDFLEGIINDKKYSEYINDMTVEISPEYSFDDEYNASMTIYYERPETEEEMRQRIEKEELEAGRVREREIKELKRLLDKYPEYRGDK